MSKQTILDRLGEHAIKSIQVPELPSTSATADVSPVIEAEQAAWEVQIGDGSDLARKHSITLCLGYAVYQAVCGILHGGSSPSASASEEGMIRQQHERVCDLGTAPSASQLLVARHQLLVDNKAR